MQEYIVFIMPPDGRPPDRVILDAYDDADALSRVRVRSAAGTAIEIWQGTRLVARIEGAHQT